MSTTSTSIPSEHPLRRRLVAELLSVPRALFWFGIFGFALGVLIDFYPGAEQDWFSISAVLIAFGFLIRQRRYRIASLILVILSTLAAFEGHKRGIEYQHSMERRRAASASPSNQP